MSIADVKRGDSVVAIYSFGSSREQRTKCTVVSVGPKWITTKNGSRFHRETGSGEYGWRIFASAEEADDLRRRAELLDAIRDASGRYGTNASKASIEELERALALVTGRRES